jgi:glutamyl-tRNA synthetase
MSIITRFAPSPTGFLHIGNARAALINWLYSHHHGGKFILRIDDTDTSRCKQEYVDAIIKDLQWLGLDWDLTFKQSSRKQRYQEVIDHLIAIGRLYPCYETQEELDFARKIQLANSRPPIYNRAALALTSEQIEVYKHEGRRPCYRFLINQEEIVWQDMIKGQVSFKGANLSDPLVIKEDGSPTYLLCSVIDDMDYKVTTIIRGEDHVVNTAIQMQMAQALKADLPKFAHLSLIKSKENKISKREGGFSIQSLREDLHFEPLAIVSFLSAIGSSRPIKIYNEIENAISDFNISDFSRSPTTYIEEELAKINHKLVSNLPYNKILPYLVKNNLENKLNEAFWLSVRANLNNIHELIEWFRICNDEIIVDNHDKEYLKSAALVLPEGAIDDGTLKLWTQKIAEITGRRGRDLYHPLRIALTGASEGPELHHLLPLIGREKIIARLLV